MHARRSLPWLGVGLLALLACIPSVALADADAIPAANARPVGMQPLSAPLPRSTPAPGESKLRLREDGSFEAIPQVSGHIKRFHLVERAAPWTIRPGLTVLANTYNGVVPGPAIVVDQGDRVVIDYTNTLSTPDTIHLHGIRGAPVSMDGVPGISQPLVGQGGHFRYVFVASDPGTFLYHTHDNEAMLDSGLYGAIVVRPAHPSAAERNLAHDFLEVISSWPISSSAESEFSLNGKSYPATRQLNVRRGERFRIRWINISGENFHTMHTHGHVQRVIARDANAVGYNDVEDTILVGPGQRADVVVTAGALPGTWLVHCHVTDHTQDGNGLPDGLITAIHYEGTPNTFASMYSAMTSASMGNMTPSRALAFWPTVLLGAIAGLTIFLGLPVARARRLSMQTVALLNALAIGILLYLVVEIAHNAIAPISASIGAWRAGAAFPLALVAVFVLGLLGGLVGLGSAAMHITKSAARQAENPLVLAAIIAVGIGAHNFAEGLAIGASAASGATALAFGLIAGFALHNATEGFGIAAPLSGRVVPSWTQLGIAGLIAGGPTFLGTMIGYRFTSPVLSVFFLAIAVGALVFVIGELWSVLKKTGLSPAVTAMMTAGFVIGLATELFLGVSGG